MTTTPREPSRLPLRGTIAAIGTIGALSLLLSFRGGPLAPGDPAVAADDSRPESSEGPVVGSNSGAGSAVALTQPRWVTGEPMPTRWGAVQVRVTLAGGDISDVVALALPDGDRHSAYISEYVEPILRQEAIAADSAAVAVVSGATYTSEAYARSLQSALDQAGHGGADAGSDPDPVVEPETAAGASPDVDAGDLAEVAAPAAGEAVTVAGEAVGIRWGDVQVAVTVEGSDIVAVETLDIPSGDLRSRRINADAEPLLREEAIALDSADVSVVSGATYTSRAYAASLQSALDQLGL